MAVPRPVRRYLLWAPLGLATVAAAVVVTLSLVEAPQGPQAQAAPPEATAGFQTTEKLVLTVTLPAADRRAAGALSVELVGADGQVLAAEQRTVEAAAEATGHRFEFS